jgi:predicted TIM-barrel fold metal-dependent hydrolase
VFGQSYETTICLTRLVFAGHLERCPNLRIVAHHGGGMIPHFAGRIGSFLEAMGPRLDEDLLLALQSLRKPPVEYFKMFYVDTALFGAKHALDCVLDFFGADHVLFGTDMPLDPEQGPGFIRDTIADIEALAIEGAERQRIYEGNARRVLGIK